MEAEARVDRLAQLKQAKRVAFDKASLEPAAIGTEKIPQVVLPAPVTEKPPASGGAVDVSVDHALTEKNGAGEAIRALKATSGRPKRATPESDSIWAKHLATYGDPENGDDGTSSEDDSGGNDPPKRGLGPPSRFPNKEIQTAQHCPGRRYERTREEKIAYLEKSISSYSYNDKKQFSGEIRSCIGFDLWQSEFCNLMQPHEFKDEDIALHLLGLALKGDASEFYQTDIVNHTQHSSAVNPQNAQPSQTLENAFSRFRQQYMTISAQSVLRNHLKQLSFDAVRQEKYLSVEDAIIFLKSRIRNYSKNGFKGIGLSW